MKYLITKAIKNQIYIDYNNQDYLVNIKGNIRLHNKPIVGDYVQCEILDNNKLIIDKILERKNQLIRPKVSNVDIVAIVQSTINPKFDTLLLDKMITFYEQFNLEVVLLITKTDLDFNHEIINKLNDYKFMNYLWFDINNDKSFNEMKNYFKNKIICLTGNSGVGKSTLINKLNPSLNLKTQEISKALNRGKHTTTNTQLIKLDNFYLIDTPGYSSIDLNSNNISKINFAHLFFKKILKNDFCRFNDCLHLEKNIDCKIKAFINNSNLIKWRYQNYLYLLNTIHEREINKNKNKKSK